MLSETELLCQPAEAYMSLPQQAFFRQLLLNQRADLEQVIADELARLREATSASDPVDQAWIDEQRHWQLRLLERQRKLLAKLHAALARLARDEYGWCSNTGEPIGLRRLLIRPTTELSIEAKELQERHEKHVIY